MFSRFSNYVAKASGRPITFATCLAVVIVWAITGPYFHYSDTWQLVINTGTTVVTFLQVFLILNAQNRSDAATQAKLDNLLKASDKASNDLIRLEEKTEEEIETLRSAQP